MSNESKLFNKNFFLLWQGQFVSQLGSQAFAIAVLFWTKHQTDSGTLVGIVLMLSLLPQVLFSAIGGAFADHYSRKNIIVACDLTSGVFMVALAVLFFFFPEADNLLFISVVIASMVVSAVKAFFNPAVIAALPDIVPPQKVAAGNSSLQMLIQLSSLAGLGLGGVLFRVLGAPLLFLFNGLSFIFSGISECFIKIPLVRADKDKETKKTVSGFKKDIIAGVKHIMNHKGLKSTFYVSALLNFFLSPIYVILPFYVEDVLQLKTDWYGYIAGIFGFGSIIGYLLVGVLRLNGSTRKNSIVVSFIVSTILVIVLSAIKVLGIVLVCFCLLGLFNGFISINILTQLQLSIKSTMRGRVMGSLMTLTGAITPLSLAASGIVLDLLDQNARIMLLVCGLLLGLLTIIILFNKSFLKFIATDPVEGLESEDAPKSKEGVLVAGEL
ncbi:MFS transporter [Pontibacter diazotrophicus]|uniref:MFS transporter n=1 Tax=Pontibacter diazotrophicus TaxID=1400979 RepID=A0A3D8KZ50_9BACT|nr:MFS transporter [Pontibacter diazotrophicus]RDV10383.1 MFS transporter [Pontibacter diazotrophicus]